MSTPFQTLQLLEKLGIDYSGGIAEKLTKFKEYLLKANQKVNLISRKRSELVFDSLVFDSLVLLQFYRYDLPATLIDVGSGGGFPWTIHKLVYPDLEIISIDSNNRKIAFQQSAARLVGFSGCRFYSERGEGISSLNGDYLIAKALGSMTMIFGLGLRHLKADGLLIVPRSGDETPPELSESEPSSRFVPVSRDSYTNPFSSPSHQKRQLLIYKKVGI